MTRERDPKDQGTHGEVRETQSSRPLTHGEFYLAMKERPDRGLGLRPGLRELFVGQQRAYRQLYEAITQSPDGTVIAIIGPHGAGKNTLFDVVMTDLIEQGRIKGEETQRLHVDFDLQEGKSFEQVRRRFSYVNTPKNPESIKPKVLQIDEVANDHSDDTKERLQEQLAIASKFWEKGVPIMVLLGNYTLEDPEIIGAIKSPHEPVYIRLDPLAPDMLKKALRCRLAYALERLPEEIDDTLIDSEVLTSLIPNTDHPVAAMRNALVDLGSIGGLLKPTEEPLTITGELVRKTFSKTWYREFWGENDRRKQKFILWLMQHINNHGNGQAMMRAMTPEDMMQACPLDIDLERYKRRIVMDLASRGIIQRVGIEPDLYLPRPEIFLMAAFKEMPLNPDSEIGKQEVKRIDKQIYALVNQQMSKNPEVWNDLIKTCGSIYGWDASFVLGLAQDVLGTFEARKKAESEAFERRMHGG